RWCRHQFRTGRNASGAGHWRGAAGADPKVDFDLWPVDRIAAIVSAKLDARCKTGIQRIAQCPLHLLRAPQPDVAGFLRADVANTAYGTKRARADSVGDVLR